MSYLNEVELNAAFLLNLKPKGGRRGNGNFNYYNAFDGRRVEYLQEECIVEKKTHHYLCLGKDATIDGTKTKYKYEEKLRKSRTKITALTLFSLYFSGKHTISLQGKYKNAAEAFHYNLKRLQAHPEFDDTVQKDINAKLEESPYKAMFKNTKGVRKDTFIDNYANLDTTARYCAFDWKKKEHIKEFGMLVPKEEQFDFYFTKTQPSPQSLSLQLKTKLKNPMLKKVLQSYCNILEKNPSYMNVLIALNVAYILSVSRTKFDEEVTQTSPFNTGNVVREFIKTLSFSLQSIDEKEHEKLYKEDIFRVYHQSLHSLIAHALVQGEYNANKFYARKNNAQDFLDEVAPQTEKEYPLNLRELNDANIDKDLKVKKAHEKLFEQLKALDGITSQIHGAEDKQKKLNKENTNLNDDGLTLKDEKKKIVKWKVLRATKPYKISISSMKGLSFFITLFTTGEALKTFNKNDIKSILEITTGINSITKTVVMTGGELLPRTNKAMKMADLLLAEDVIPQRIIAKLAIPTVIIGAYYEMEALDNEDYDAMVAITTKVAITIALAFVSGFWIAAAGYIALEILWYLFSNYFVDSKAEIMIEKSLFYESGINGRRSYMLSSLETGNGLYLTQRGHRDAPLQARSIHSIGNPKVIREFIYKNYEANKQDFITAARYEFSEIYRALKNISINVEKIPTYYKNTTQTIELNLNGYLRVNKEYYNEMKGVIYLLKNDNYRDPILIDTTDAQNKDKDKLIDLFESLKKELSPTKLDEESKNNYNILIDSGATSVKYKLEIEYNYHTETVGNRLVKKIDYYLNELIPMPLTSSDLELLK